MSQIQPQTQALTAHLPETTPQLTLAEAGGRAAKQRTWTLVGVLDARTAASVTRTLRKGWPAREGRLTLDLTGLTAISMVREMGPLITAILVAGRSGSSIASEVATMKVGEEVGSATTASVVSSIFFIIVADSVFSILF